MSPEHPAAGLPPRVETVLLDAGGVLLDLDYAYLHRLLEARGHGTDAETLARAEAVARDAIHQRVSAGGRSGEAWRDYFRILFHEVSVPAAVHEEIINALWEAHRRVGLWTVAVPGAVDVVIRLRSARYRVGVVSNAEGKVARDLKAAGFDGLLDTVVDSHRVGVEKPDPAIFRIALERLKASSDTAIHVGDVPAVDVEGARAAGIAPVLVDRYGLYRELDVPRIRSLRELPDLLG